MTTTILDFWHSKLLNSCPGETAIILGSGPSLKRYDLQHPFFSKYKTFGSNGIFRSGFRPNYYFITDPEAVKIHHDSVKAMFCAPTGSWPLNVVVSPWSLLAWYELCKEMNPADDDIVFYRELFESRSILASYNLCDVIGPPSPGRLFTGRTSGVLMAHIAWHMGFQNIFLLGIDGYAPANSEAKSNPYFYQPGAEHPVRDPSDDVQIDLAQRECLRLLVEEAYDEERNVWSLSRLSAFNDVVPLWPTFEFGVPRPSDP